MDSKIARNILFVGIGGGNDVFSAILASLALRGSGFSWDTCSIAGVLSPFHSHATVKTDIPGCDIIRPHSERFVVRNDRRIKISFVDSAVSDLIGRERDLRISECFGLSLANGSNGLAATFRELSKRFDRIMLVDVGGDCFYRGREDAHVLSPMFDSIVLRGFIDSGVGGLLFEAGPGTDGELDPEALESALYKSKATEYPLAPEDVARWEILYHSYISSIRKGNTVPTTIDAYKSKVDVITREYRFRAHIGDFRLHSSFIQRIKTSLSKKYYIVEPGNITNPFAVACDDPLEWFLQTQVRQHRTHNEADMEFLRMGEELYQFVTPSPLFDPGDRLLLLNRSLQEFCERSCDAAWMLPRDWESMSLSWRHDIKATKQGDLIELRR